jgi:predicted ferric reductase
MALPPDLHDGAREMTRSWLISGYVAALTLPAISVVVTGGHSGSLVILVCGFAGMAALVMLAVQFVTSGRFERLAAPIGLDAMMGFHRLAGRAVALAIFVHVVLAIWLAAGGKTAEVPAAAVRLFTSGRMMTGSLAFAGIVALVWAATRRDRIGLRYEWWRATHGIGALLFLALAAHHAWTNGLFLRSPGTAVLAGSAIAVAAGSFVVIHVVRAWRSKHADWIVTQVRRLDGRLHEITLSRSAASPFHFQAGQFAWVTFGRQHPITDHPFSIASSPAELPRLRFIIKENGDFTGGIASLPVGTPAYLDGPHGNFIADRSVDAIVLIAGGVGIAPVISILRSLAEDGYQGSVALMIATRTQSEQLFAGEAEQLASKLNLKVMTVVEQASPAWRGATGRIDRDKLSDLLRGLPLGNMDILICGPFPMMAAASRMLVDLGAPPQRIHYERFDYHEGSDLKSRTMRRRFRVMLGCTAVLLLLTAVAGAYLSSAAR